LREIQNYRKSLLGTVLVAACAHCIVASITGHEVISSLNSVLLILTLSYQPYVLKMDTNPSITLQQFLGQDKSVDRIFQPITA